jgi:hypothetical protein
MKKSIIYLGIALVAVSNVSFATNNKAVANPQRLILTYGAPTPLCLAISKGEFELVKKFIEYGSDINEKSNGMTPLMVAARYNKLEIVKFLLEKGADLKDRDDNGFTALKHAEISNAKEAAAFLQHYK